jgi:DNA-binding Xre family transcriptional regulator
MSPDDRRERIKRLAQEHTYQFRAYLSSGLTNLTDTQRNLLLNELEDLYIEVFHPMDIFLYLPHLWSDPGHNSQMTPAHVHILDRLRIAESDFLVLCADYPSFGAGQEFEIAQATGLRILLYHKEGERVSRMILGGAGLQGGQESPTSPQTPIIVRYSDFHDLKQQLKVRASELRGQLRGESATQKVPDFSARLKKVMMQRGVTSAELAEATGFTPQFVQFLLSSNIELKRVLERWDLPQFPIELDITKYINPGLWVIRMLCRAMNVETSELVETELTSAEAQRRASEARLMQVARRVAERRNISLVKWNRLQEEVRSQDAVAARSASDRDLENLCEEILNRID